MLGLRSAGHLAGFTRLCDEFLMALDHAPEPGPFADDARALAFLDEAVRRVRSFARGGEATGGFGRDESGLLLFELQGYEYAASFARVELSAKEGSFASLRAPLEAASARAVSAARGEQVPIGLVVAAIGDAGEDELRRLLAEARENDFTHALAYALPSTPGERQARWVDPAWPGVLMLAQRP
jgi:hypothetical protein